ncbi:MAG: hypothetical protein L6R40_008263 [Gallowayella cf. fulva]|nr:MAG: hypothetical protein L6R40_008263 [Xanthomendoza cf. fulva]
MSLMANCCSKTCIIVAFSFLSIAEELAIPATLSKAAHWGEMEIVSLRPNRRLEASVVFLPSAKSKPLGLLIFTAAHLALIRHGIRALCTGNSLVVSPVGASSIVVMGSVIRAPREAPGRSLSE